MPELPRNMPDGPLLQSESSLAMFLGEMFLRAKSCQLDAEGNKYGAGHGL